MTTVNNINPSNTSNTSNTINTSNILEIGFVFIVILTFVITFVITISRCLYNQEHFESIDQGLMQRAKDYISVDASVYSKDSFSVEKMKKYFLQNQDQSVLIEIRNNNYTLTFKDPNDIKAKKVAEFMKLIKSKFNKLPDATFVHHLGDTQITHTVPILHNSVPNDSPAILSPIWYWIMKKNITDVLDNPVIWEDKIPQSIWRGSPTGWSSNDHRDGHKISRKYVTDISKKFPDIIDAGFVRNTNITTISSSEFKNSMSPLEQLNYKWIISMDGNGGTYGLYWTLSSGSCVVNNAMHKQWFSPFFKAGRHYIPFNDSEDSPNLPEIIKNCIEMQGLSKNIGQNSRGLSKLIFNDEFICQYFLNVIEMYSQMQK
jgi:hypothetical protein